MWKKHTEADYAAIDATEIASLRRTAPYGFPVSLVFFLASLWLHIPTPWSIFGGFCAGLSITYAALLRARHRDRAPYWLWGGIALLLLALFFDFAGNTLVEAFQFALAIHVGTFGLLLLEARTKPFRCDEE